MSVASQILDQIWQNQLYWTHIAFLARDREIYLSSQPGTLLGTSSLLNGCCDIFLEGRRTTQCSVAIKPMPKALTLLPYTLCSIVLRHRESFFTLIKH